jgi:hypothetical protein
MDKDEISKLLELENDELVIWSGRPEPYEVMDKIYKPVFIRNYIITFLIIIPIYVAAFIRNMNGGDLNLTALAVICCFPLVVIPAGLSQYREYGKRCRYFITNRNVIVSWDSRRLKYPISDIAKYDSAQLSEEAVTVLIGKAVGMPARKIRDYALRCLSETTDGERPKGCVLYNLPPNEAGTVLELIAKCRVVA